MILNPINKIDRTHRLSVSTHQPFNHTGLHSQLDNLSRRKQWIMFTAQCPRQDVVAFAAHQTWTHKVIHIMPSRQLSEVEVVDKAIRSGNASAIVASNQIAKEQQHWLTTLAGLHHCQLFFADTTNFSIH
jgi:cell division inhibitor SulA